MERLQKLISSTGRLSRRKAEEAIVAGRVTVNGKAIRELGTKADPLRDEIRLDGERLVFGGARITIALHKPRHVVTTRHDPEGRRTVIDLLPRELEALRPVGRLDYESEGLLLLTNDGELAHRVTHPSYDVRKIYHVWFDARLSVETLRELKLSVPLEDGPGRFERVDFLRADGGEQVYEIEVSEGRNRFIRRMGSAVGHPVKRLKRVSIGPIELGRLPPGELRPLDTEELGRIHRMIGLD